MSTKPAVNEAAVIAFRDAAEFEAWLDEHVAGRGVAKIAKKRVGVPSLTDDEARSTSACATAGSQTRQPMETQYITAGALCRYTRLSSCLSMKSATSAREIIGTTDAALMSLPCR